MLKAKSGKAQNWIPGQVVYGMDCSDPNPDNWKPFGRVAEEEAAKGSKAKPLPVTTIPA